MGNEISDAVMAERLAPFDWKKYEDGVYSIYGVKDRAVTSLTIPEGVGHIGEESFGKCRMLESITIPDSVANADRLGLSAACQMIRQ